MSKNAANLARNTATQDRNNATSLEGTLTPLYKRMAMGQSTPGSVAANTAAQQSVGGSVAGALGDGNLRAARDRNAGGFAPALDEAVRSGQQTLSNDASRIAAQNADKGIAGLQGLYGTNSSQALNALGQYETDSDNTFWNQLGKSFAGGGQKGGFGGAAGAALGGLF